MSEDNMSYRTIRGLFYFFQVHGNKNNVDDSGEKYFIQPSASDKKDVIIYFFFLNFAFNSLSIFSVAYWIIFLLH